MSELVFLPLLGWPMLWAFGVVSLAILGLSIWRGGRAWWLRAVALAVILAALSGPHLQSEERRSLTDIIIAVVDETASQGFGERALQTQTALEKLETQVAALENTELRVVRVQDAADNSGSLAMATLVQALAKEPQSRISGVVMITDGRVHDIALTPDMPAPFHALLTGAPQDWDRRLVIENAPAFAIIGEEFMLNVRIEDQGNVPDSVGGETELTITVDAYEPQSYQVPVGVDLELPITLPHGGMNVIQFEISASPGELTTRNNVQSVQINGVRDRLRVLLVSGEPHSGERVWRNLLKSDASVDLVHFTILRPPEKQDNVSVDEMSLIAFPTRELFIEKISEFDLIIFDRYRMRGILPMSYLENVVNYVRNGGTVLVANGPEYGAVDSLYRSPLAQILPVAPTAQVVEGAFVPLITDLGQRHPVTAGLDPNATPGEDSLPNWGRWLRAIETELLSGEVVMEGPDGLPLLVLDRVDEGRVAVLNSDQAWLWGRGYDGGGPQLELLRRLAHWMLKEPDLEEEALTAELSGADLLITRRSISDFPPGPVSVTLPDGTTQVVDLVEASPGLFEAKMAAPKQGLYRLEQGDLLRVFAVGSAYSKEFEQVIATDEVFKDPDLLAARRPSVTWLHEGMPSLRTVASDRQSWGRGWIGITPRDAYVTSDIRLAPVMPQWLWLIIAAGVMMAAWLVEGRRSNLSV